MCYRFSRLCFNAVKRLTIFLLLSGLSVKIWAAVRVILLCVIVTETALPLTKLYSGKQCYIYTFAKVKALENECVNTCWCAH